MFCGIDFMAIWFFLKESVLILLLSILTTTFSTDFSKVLKKVKFDPENSPALNKFLEHLLTKHENLEWVDRLSQTYTGIGLSNSGLEMRKKILKRNDHCYRQRRKLRPYYTNYRNQNQNFNLDEISHLNLDDYENALTGVLKKNGYKQQRVKQKRYITVIPPTTQKYKNHTYFDLLDLSIIDPMRNGRTNNYQYWISNNNKRNKISKNKSKRQAITTDGYVQYVEQPKKCGSKPNINIKSEELEELMKVVEPVTKIKNHNLSKNKTLDIMNSKKNGLTITKSLAPRKKNYVSSKNQLETTTVPKMLIVVESLPTEKTLERKSITMTASNKVFSVNSPADMISNKIKIENHPQKNFFLDNFHIEQQIDASPTNAKIKSINLDSLHIMTDPYLFHFTKTTVSNSAQPNNVQKREKIVEENPASVMSPEEIRRAKIEAAKLLDVDKDFNERNEPNFNKEVMTTENNDYKEIDDYLDLKDKDNQKQQSNRIQRKILKSEEKREIKSNEIQQNSFFSRQLLHYDYDDDDYENKVYSNYDYQENSLRRYPRNVNQNYKLQNVGDDYFDYQNEEPLERRFYKKKWKNQANCRNNEPDLYKKNKLKNKINKLKNFFGFGHENNYNENVEDDYPVKNMAFDDYTAKNNELIENNLLKSFSENLSEKPKDLKNIYESHDSGNVITKNYFDQQNNFDSNTLSKKSSARSTSQTKSDSTLNSFDLYKESEQNKIQKNDQSTTPNQNSIQENWQKNLIYRTITETTFPDPSNFKNDASKSTSKSTSISTSKAIKSNTQSSNLDKLLLYDFTTKLETATLPFDPLSYSFNCKINLFDDSTFSTSNFPLPKKIVNSKEKRESIMVKKLLAHFKMKQNTKIIPQTLTTVKLNDKDLSINSNIGKTYIDKYFSLNNKKNKKKLTNKYKFRHLSRYHSNLKEMLKALPIQVPVAQIHVDELKLEAIKKNQEKNKKLHTREISDDCANKINDLDDEDYIPSDYEFVKNSDTMARDNDELKHFDQIVKHNAESSSDSDESAKKHKPYKHRSDIENEKNAMKLVGRKKIEDNNKKGYANSDGNNKKQSKTEAIEETKNINSLQTINKKQGRKIFDENQHTQLVCPNKNYVKQIVIKNSCPESSLRKPTYTRTTTKTYSTRDLALNCPLKKTPPTTTCLTRKTTTCKTTTSPTTICKTTTSPTTTCKTTTCPTTYKTTTCPTTTCKKTTSKKTTCPTTCKTTTCRSTTCKKTTCPTTCKKTTCPTTTCKTTTCPTTTCKTTTCPTTTCKTTTKCPTTCKSTCPTKKTCNTTTKKCRTTCKSIFKATSPTTCSKTKAISCTPTCRHVHSTHKFGMKCSPGGKTYNFFDRPKRKIIHNSQYFDNKYHQTKFNADRASRHLIFPNRKYLYSDMPKNEYQDMKHKNLISRLKRKYLPRQNKSFAETRENNLIRRKKSINYNKDVKHIVEMPVYKVYPKKIRHGRYRRRKMKNDDTEDEKQRKVLETIYRHRIQRRRNEPEYVRKSHSYDYTENKVNLPFPYNSEIKKNVIRRTRMEETTSNDSDISNEKIPAIVVQDLYMDINKSKSIKKIIGKALRSPQYDPKNPFDTIYKLPPTHQEVTNLLSMYNRLPQPEKRRHKYIYNYLHTQKLFLERLMHQFTKYNRQHRKLMLRKKRNFQQRNHHVVWVPNELSGSSENSNYTKLKKRMISDDHRENLTNRMKRENYFSDIMKSNRKPKDDLSKLDQWMKVKNEEHKPLYFNFTF